MQLSQNLRQLHMKVFNVFNLTGVGRGRKYVYLCGTLRTPQATAADTAANVGHR